jgi:Cof subfamily protein (haloacid dehalogenase superfamily)
MKTLYISDLDGTLLNGNAEVSEFTQTEINKIIRQGAYFTVATARTAATVLSLAEGIDINVPIILMNGVSVYDTKTNSYVKTHFIEKAAVSRLIDRIETYDMMGFLYILEEGALSTYYKSGLSESAKKFIEERQRKFKKHFTQADSFYHLKEKPVIYFSVCEPKEKLMPFYESLRSEEQLHIEFYRDIYQEGCWYLEICSKLASKENAIRFLRKEYQFDKVISFGDNLNDLSMFSGSDESYAVSNARPEVREKATAVIGSNIDDGVARWLMQREKTKIPESDPF